jgi:hypothetical protein
MQKIQWRCQELSLTALYTCTTGVNVCLEGHVEEKTMAQPTWRYLLPAFGSSSWHQQPLELHAQ